LQGKDSRGGPIADTVLTGGTVYDAALQSFVRIIMETTTCPELQQMTNHPKIQRMLPGYSCTMGFGLHCGWAIEGAIGSTLKIDASYLSPHVNAASRLEAATTRYRTQILMSGKFARRLSPGVASLCRRVDKVAFKGKEKPVDILTYDVPLTDATSLDEIEADPDYNFFEQFAPATTASYRKEFASAVDLYCAGDWEAAHPVVLRCLAQWPADGPAQSLLSYLEKHQCRAPAMWPGYRTYTS